MTVIFTQLSRRGMPERAQKNLTMESSKDIVGSYLLGPEIGGYGSASSKTHGVLARQATGKASIDVTAQVTDYTASGVEATSMFLRSELGSIKLLLVAAKSFSSCHGHLTAVKQRCSTGPSSAPRVFNASDAPMISKEVRDASPSVQASDYDIRPSGYHHLGKDIAEVIAPFGRVHVRFEGQVWKGVREVRIKFFKI